MCSATSLEHGPNLITPNVSDNSVGAVISYECDEGYTMEFNFDKLEEDCEEDCKMINYVSCNRK